MSNLDPIPYPDAQLRAILQRVKTIAMVGASSNWNRPSYFVMKYLQGKGYRVIPVNPGIAGQSLLGEKVYAALRDIPEPVNMVDVFRAAREAPAIVEDAIAIGAKVYGCSSASAMTRRPRCREGRDRGRHEPLPEDRVRPVGRRAVVERGEYRIIRNRPPEPPIAKRDRQRATPSRLSYGFETRAIHAGQRPTR